MSESPVYSRDGFIARPAGDYARNKLSFLGHYLPPAIDTTETKRRSV
jgi:hypothetical protein